MIALTSNAPAVVDAPRRRGPSNGLTARRILYLFRHIELDTHTISKRLGCSEAKVANLLARARDAEHDA